jgi:hypothetical protein
MKSTFANERVLGRGASFAGDASDIRSKFKVGLARINQELWLVLSLFVIAALFNWLVASHRRAFAMTGDTPPIRTSLRCGKMRNPDIPILKEAKAEYAKLH